MHHESNVTRCDLSRIPFAGFLQSLSIVDVTSVLYVESSMVS